MKVIGAYGINNHDGADTVDLALADLAELGYETETYQRGMRHTWGVYSKKKRYADALGLAAMLDNETWILAHSYGGYVSSKALKMCTEWGTEPAGLIMLNPAMSRSYYKRAPELKETKTRIYCFHSMQDRTIWFGGKLWGHEFGMAGRKGFKGDRVNNFEIMGKHSNSFTDKMRPLRAQQYDGIIRDVWTPRVVIS